MCDACDCSAELSLRGTIALEVGEALHLSPSSVSQQLSQLEREARVELLQRAGRRVQLTPAAEVLVEHTGVILDRLDQAEADIANLGGQASGTLRIAAFQSATVAFIYRDCSRRSGCRGTRGLRVTVSQREREGGVAGDGGTRIRSGERRAVPESTPRPVTPSSTGCR